MARTKMDRINETVQSLITEVNRYLSVDGLASVYHWSFEDILDWRKTKIYGHPRWKKLPRWAQERVQSVVNTLWFNHERRYTIWTLVLDGRRYFTQSKELSDRHREVSEQMQADPEINFGAHCYAVRMPDSRIVLVPYRESDRVKEIRSGRLASDDCEGGETLMVKSKPQGGYELVRYTPIELTLGENSYQENA